MPRNISKTSRRRNITRRFHLEKLESRKLLAALVGEESQRWWTGLDASSIPSQLESSVRAAEYRVAELNVPGIRAQLSNAPANLSAPLSESNVLSIPTPRGSFERFQIFVSPVMAPELAAKFPEITTYAGQGIDDPSATIRLDLTPQGFHAQVIGQDNVFYIDPYSRASSDYYAIYAKGTTTVDTGFRELQSELNNALSGGAPSSVPPASLNGVHSRSGTQLRTYRLAMAATGEYTAFHGGTVTLGQAAIVTAVNRLTGIYQTEATIAFELVPDNDKLVYTDAANDPYTNNNGVTMLGENQANVDRVIGNGNYDIGHVFSTGGGGVASLGSVGIDNRKAQGVTGLDTPIGDDFWVDYVAHEMGHQFGGEHTFNSNEGSCQGNRSSRSAYEPGSGVSIQAYAGICGSDDLQPHSIPYFHSVSLDQFIAHVDGVIPNVGKKTPTGNSIPTVNAGPDVTIPARTPFALTAVGSDADAANKLTYDWQQRDLGPSQQITDPDNGSSPLFRVWSPTEDPTRTFPRLSDLVQNKLSKGEKLPTTNRDLNFRVIVRDNVATGAAFDVDDMKIKVVDTGSPFAVVTPNTNVTWEGATFQTIEWNVAGTTSNGINAANVDISLSIDGGMTYPFALARGVPNSGTASVRIPNAPTSNARIRVQGAQNIFFDISDVDFVISPATKILNIDLGSRTNYVENAAPAFFALDATLTNQGVTSFDNATLTVSIDTNFETGDTIDIASRVDPTGDVSVSNGVVKVNGIAVATYNGPGKSFIASFNASATDTSIQAIVRSLSFVHSTEDPTPNDRGVSVFLDNGLNGFSNKPVAVIAVVPQNDPPKVANATLASINEDTSPTGVTIASLVSPVFSDFDRGSSMSGIAVVSNPGSSATGQWQYSLQGFSWLPIGSVSITEGLVLSPQTLIRFLPAKDYFGAPPKLLYRALDNTYGGGVTNSARVTLDVSRADPLGAVSITDQSIGIQVLPVNDAPVVTVTARTTSTDEDQPMSFAVSPGWFSDVDDTKLSISVQSADGSPLPSWMSFSPQTNLVTGAPTNDQVGTYSLAIVATDAAGESTSLRLTLIVNNINDAPVDINFVTKPLRENSFNALVGTLFATDPDSNDLMTWTITDPRFELRGNLVYLAPNKTFDYEQGSQINVTIRATDNGVPPLFIEQQKTITVLDENEFSPMLLATSFNAPEDTASPSQIARVSAADADTANTVRYRFSGTPSPLFSLDGVTGQIALKPGAALDYESQDTYQFFVEAYDDGLPVRATTASVNIHVLDVNEFSPVLGTAEPTVSENQPTDAPFFRIAATDGDKKQTIRYELLPTENRFRIDGSNGDLSLLQDGVLDFEIRRVESIVVLATDSGTPPRSTQQTIVLRVADANDAPTAASVEKTSLRSGISDFNLGKITITDQDVGQSYQIVSLDERFKVVDGNLVVAPGKSLNESDPQQVQIPINVTELGQDSRTYPMFIALTRVPNPKPWQNKANPLDVDRSGDVGPLDVLTLINAINGEFVKLINPRPASTLDKPDYDADGDEQIGPLDVLSIINAINTKKPGGEGEQKPSISRDELVVTPMSWLAAFQQIEEERSTRRKRS